MDYADLELGTGLWRTGEYVRRLASELSSNSIKNGRAFPSAFDMPSSIDYILSNRETAGPVNHHDCLVYKSITGNPIYRDLFTHSPYQ